MGAYFRIAVRGVVAVITFIIVLPGPLGISFALNPPKSVSINQTDYALQSGPCSTSSTYMQLIEGGSFEEEDWDSLYWDTYNRFGVGDFERICVWIPYFPPTDGSCHLHMHVYYGYNCEDFSHEWFSAVVTSKNYFTNVTITVDFWTYIEDEMQDEVRIDLIDAEDNIISTPFICNWYSGGCGPSGGMYIDYTFDIGETPARIRFTATAICPYRCDAPFCAPGIAAMRVDNIRSDALQEPPAGITLSSISRFREGSETTYLPTELAEVQVGDGLRVIGRVFDTLGIGFPDAVVRCFDPITGDLLMGDSAIFRVITDADGYFVYPDSIMYPLGMACGEETFSALWFNVGAVASPLIVAVSEVGETIDAMVDSLEQWIAEIGFPPGTRLGIIDDPSDPFIVEIDPYPLNDENLDDAINDAFFEAYAWMYNGSIEEGFLSADDSGWLERGLRINAARVLDVMDTLRSYFAANQSNLRPIAYIDENGETFFFRDGNAPMDFWSDAGDFILTYGIDMGICAVGLATTVGAIACAPLVINLANDYIVKPHVVRLVCNDGLQVEDPAQCQAVGEMLADGVALVSSVATSGGTHLGKHAGWFMNPRNLKFGRPFAALLLLKDIKTYADGFEFGFEVGDVYSKYGQNPGNGHIESFGFGGLQYQNVDNPYLNGTSVTVALTILDAPKFDIASAWDNPGSPSHLELLIRPDRNLFNLGTTDYVSPGLIISSGGIDTYPSFQQIDFENNVYTATILVNDLPNFSPHLPYKATVESFGHDLTSNYGSWDSPCAIGICGVEGLNLTNESGEGIIIPPGAVSGSVGISVNTGQPASPPGAQKVPLSEIIQYDISGNILVVQPDTLNLLIPGEITLRFNTNDLKYSTEGTELMLGRWNVGTDSWGFLVSSIDSTTGVISAEISQLGAFAAIFKTTFICDCLGFCEFDLDGTIDPLDVAYIVNYVYRQLDARPVLPYCPRDNGDWNCDGGVDPLDVAFYVQFVYKSIGDGPCDPCAE